MKPKATLKQISKDLGISVSTVSKALSDSHEISEPTKIRVQEYAKLQNYKPNTMAKNLKNQRTNTIGVIIPNILNPFFAKVFSGIEKAANAKGYNVITYISNESHAKEKQAMDLLSNGTVDGFILSVAQETQSLHETQHFKDILREGMPIVMFDRTMEDVSCDKVIVDDFESSVEAVNHLMKLGCNKIALLSCIDNLSVGKHRALGYERALQDHKRSVEDYLVIKTDSEEDFDARLKKLLSSGEVDGILAVDEHASTMAMKVAIQKGIKIPEELCIIGFADGVWSRRLTPSLSTISQHGPEIGEEAAKLLIEKLERKQEIPTFKTTVVKTELRQRDSTRRV
ncbi:MAG TPA: LacI family DNA-binding transcriptional regulator [Flavobacterium sp.]|jgi:LacI family transcriptional regulator|uniref:LacI family DNA-binding transcriptional regulator n=1 Tax=Flavobacterium sp. TaxID=239 RepID=UPI0025C09D8E|nr:LacI family DNA-binding transcriptional regulator [Flavobacterium sp.]MBA4155033.1 LacI family transcriptional regulator [Flavobacterium sp.]HQX04956.1 LacI family DNA-binding transcriptional regulator [Flavobacterium sp.]HRZ73741.1 LacI family DNA-binding transcriptional regulator [Flavobacterium sp.]